MDIKMADKLSFINKLSLLSKATSDDSEPTPGYMYPEVNNISFESVSHCNDLAEWLVDRLAKKSCHVKLKVLRIMKYVVTNGHPCFRQWLRKNSHRIADAEKHSGPPDPLHGNAPYLAVRLEAKELSCILFTVVDEEAESAYDKPPQIVRGLGSSGTAGAWQGFGNTISTNSKSISDSIRDGIQDLAVKAANIVLSTDGRNDMTFTVPYSTPVHFPTYKPVDVPCADFGRPAVAGSMTVTELKPSCVRMPRVMHVRKPGVAGGGWESDSDGDETVRRLDIVVGGSQLRQPSFKHSPTCSSSGSVERNVDISKLEDWSAEVQLVNSFVGSKNEPFPQHSEIKIFVACCSDVSCDKVVELLSAAMDASHTTATLRALLAVEALLRTDLVMPDYIATTCCQQLRALYLCKTADDAVQQKSRKVIRILEKLAPCQAELFSGLPTMLSPSNRLTDTDCTFSANGASDVTLVTAADQKASNTNFSAAFPFLTRSKVST